MMLATALAVAASRDALLVDKRMLAPPLAALLCALGAGGVLNYRKQWNFCSSSVLLLFPLLLAAGLTGLALLPNPARLELIGCAQAGLLNTFALTVFLGLICGCALAFGFPAAIALGGITLCLGLLSDYLAQTLFAGSPAGRALTACWPNWQRFWVADLLRNGTPLPWAGIAWAAAYALTYTLFILLLCMRKFRRVELP